MKKPIEYIPKTEEIHTLQLRVPEPLFMEIAEASGKLEISLNTFYVAAARYYLDALKDKGSV